jgi:hypothetical protein
MRERGENGGHIVPPGRGRPGLEQALNLDFVGRYRFWHGFFLLYLLVERGGLQSTAMMPAVACPRL